VTKKLQHLGNRYGFMDISLGRVPTGRQTGRVPTKTSNHGGLINENGDV
jgi:hypothetical protein